MATYNNCNTKQIGSIQGKEQIREFFDLCREIGIETLEGVAFFIKYEIQRGATLLDALRDYAWELKNGQL